MLISIVKNVFEAFIPLIKFVAIPIGVTLAIFIFLIFVNYFYYRFIKKVIPKRIGRVNRLSKDSFLKKLFVLAPRQLVLNFLHREIGEFPEQGIILFEGKQGQGKTLAITHHLLESQKKYPNVKVATNYGYLNENVEMDDWHLLLNYKNGKNGVIFAIDELPNWFSSAQSKDFPPEMLEVVTQNRKNHRVIYGTCHTFSMVSKNIRIQTKEVRKVHTIFKCITIVTRLEPSFDSSGDVKKYIKKGRYWFVHSDELYNAYDTMRVIERYQPQERKEPAKFYDF